MVLNKAPFNGANFQTYEGSTVVSRRNFGLIRGKSLQNALNLLHLMNSDEENSKDLHSSSSDSQISPPNGNKKKAKATFGQGGFGDKSCNMWHWPLGPVAVRNTDTSFQASVGFTPFKKNEISAKIMGNDLIIHCRTDDSYPGPHREFYRTYQLPLNLDTSSVRFTVTDSNRLTISGQKHLPMKLAIAFCNPDEACEKNI